MRPKERIPIFWKFADGFVTNILIRSYGISRELDDLDQTVENIYALKDEMLDYWNANPDLRFSQVLVNLGRIPNIPGGWYYMEEHEVLDALGISLRRYLLWGSIYDKDSNRLSETIYRTIEQLDSDHIKAIIRGEWTKDETYLNAFNEELRRRGDG